MMHGAAIVVLHIPPLAVITVVQQDGCAPGKRRGMLSSEGRNSAFAQVER